MKLSSKLLKIKSAILLKLIATVKYHDLPRDVEIHVLGKNFDKNYIVRVFEKSRENKITNVFKTFLVSDIQSISLSKIPFTQSVNKNTDELMSKIILTTYNAEKKEK